MKNLSLNLIACMILFLSSCSATKIKVKELCAIAPSGEFICKDSRVSQELKVKTLSDILKTEEVYFCMPSNDMQETFTENTLMINK